MRECKKYQGKKLRHLSLSDAFVPLPSKALFHSPPLLCCCCCCCLEPCTAKPLQAICSWVDPLKCCCAGIIVTGDLNAPPDEELHSIMAAHGFLSTHRVSTAHSTAHVFLSSMHMIAQHTAQHSTAHGLMSIHRMRTGQQAAQLSTWLYGNAQGEHRTAHSTAQQRASYQYTGVSTPQSTANGLIPMHRMSTAHSTAQQTALYTAQGEHNAQHTAQYCTTCFCRCTGWAQFKTQHSTAQHNSPQPSSSALLPPPLKFSPPPSSPAPSLYPTPSTSLLVSLASRPHPHLFPPSHPHLWLPCRWLTAPSRATPGRQASRPRSWTRGSHTAPTTSTRGRHRATSCT